jgi:hypothetical protein
MLTPRGHRSGSVVRRGDVWLLILAVVLLIFAVRSWTEWRALARLLDHGVLVPAQNISARIEASRRYSTDVVHYDFQLEDGAPGSSGVERFRRGPWPDLDPLEMPRNFYQGGLNVRYLPEDPRVHRLDLALARRMGSSRRSALLWLASAAIVGTLGVVLLVRAGRNRSSGFVRRSLTRGRPRG